MKFLLFSLLLISTLNVCGQFFSFQQEWFENESFFKDSTIRKNNIAAIHIWLSEKDDGQAFKTERDFLHYEFNQSGKLSASYKSVALRKKIDTATFIYSYNKEGKLSKRSERQGLFHFNYYYFYTGDMLFKEVKINAINSAIDTTYLHYFEYDSTNNVKRITTLNALKKPFLYLTKEFDKKDHLIKETKSYRRNQGYNETNYSYEDGQLIKVKKSYGSNSQHEIIISRDKEKLDLISFFQDEKLIKKYAFTYHLNGLPKAIIERNLVEKKITIYRLEYLLYSN